MAVLPVRRSLNEGPGSRTSDPQGGHPRSLQCWRAHRRHRGWTLAVLVGDASGGGTPPIRVVAHEERSILRLHRNQAADPVKEGLVRSSSRLGSRNGPLGSRRGNAPAAPVL